MTSVFQTPEGKVRYTGKFRYIVCIKRANVPLGRTYSMLTLKRSNKATTIMEYLTRSREGRMMIRDRTPFIIDTVTGECVDASHFLRGTRYVAADRMLAQGEAKHAFAAVPDSGSACGTCGERQAFEQHFTRGGNLIVRTMDAVS